MTSEAWWPVCVVLYDPADDRRAAVIVGEGDTAQDEARSLRWRLARCGVQEVSLPFNGRAWVEAAPDDVQRAARRLLTLAAQAAAKVRKAGAA